SPPGRHRPPTPSRRSRSPPRAPPGASVWLRSGGSPREPPADASLPTRARPSLRPGEQEGLRPPPSEMEEALDDDRRRDIALFRYALIRQAADPSLTERERGTLVRALTEADHQGPGGDRVRVSRNTLDRWIRMWGAGGFDVLAPKRRDGIARTPRRVLD